MNTPAWQQRRSRLNHDWLKNQFLPALGHCLNLLDDLVEDIAFERSFVAKVLPQWETHLAEVRALPEDFERDMSPRTLFAYPPLANCDAETRRWLGDLVHVLWLARYPVRRWVSRATARAREAHAAFKRLSHELDKCPDTRSAQALRPLRLLVAQFRSACYELALAIEQFPSEVKVT